MSTYLERETLTRMRDPTAGGAGAAKSRFKTHGVFKRFFGTFPGACKSARDCRSSGLGRTAIVLDREAGSHIVHRPPNNVASLLLDPRARGDLDPG